MDVLGLGFTVMPPFTPVVETKKKEATFIGISGMGDLILLAPAAVYSLRYYETIYFPCRSQQENSVRGFFTQYDDRIIVYSLNNKVVINGVEMLQYDGGRFRGDLLGCWGRQVTNIDPSVSFAETYYNRLGIPYQERWECDPLPGASKAYIDTRNESVSEYTFVHHDRKRGYAIKDKYLYDGFCVYPSEDDCLPILAYATLIRNAKRIKVIDSAFLHLCESLPTRDDAELEYHKYAKPLEHRTNDANVPSRKNWKIIND